MPGPEDGALRLCAVSVETSLGWRARYDALYGGIDALPRGGGASVASAAARGECGERRLSKAAPTEMEHALLVAFERLGEANAQLSVQHSSRAKLEKEISSYQQQVKDLQRQLREATLELTETKRLMRAQPAKRSSSSGGGGGGGGDGDGDGGVSTCRRSTPPSIAIPPLEAGPTPPKSTELSRSCKFIPCVVSEVPRLSIRLNSISLRVVTALRRW